MLRTILPDTDWYSIDDVGPRLKHGARTEVGSTEVRLVIFWRVCQESGLEETDLVGIERLISPLSFDLDRLGICFSVDIPGPVCRVQFCAGEILGDVERGLGQIRLLGDLRRAEGGYRLLWLGFARAQFVQKLN